MKVHRFMMRMFDSYPEPDATICRVAYILLFGWI